MLGFLNRYLRPRWPHVLLMAALVLGNEGVNLLGPQVVRFFIDTARAGGAIETLVLAGALFLGIAIVNQAAGVAESTVASNLGWHATNDLRADLAAHCLRLDMPFHNAHTPGELIERVDGDVGVLRNFFSRFVVLMLGGVLFLAAVLVLLWLEDRRVGLFSTVMSAIGLAVLVWGRLKVVPHSIAARQASADVFGFVEERLGGLPDIQGNGLQRHTIARLEALIGVWFRRVRRAFVLGAALAATSGTIWVVTTTATLAGVAWLFGAGAISLGTAYLLVYYAQEAQSTVRQIARQLEDFQRASAALVRVRELETIRPRIAGPAASATRRLPDGPLSVEFAGVSFAYAGEWKGGGMGARPDGRSVTEAVVRDVSFRLEAGRTLGVLGRTGGGKTTLTRLLFRLYDVDTGAVEIGGVDVRHARLEELHRRVALVTQEVQLFRGTVRDNVTLFDRSVADRRVIAALRQGGLGGWLDALPAGLDTEIEAGGLSAGEAQLLAFARVFLRDPSVVVLDEASSRLDPATEARIERAVDRLLGVDDAGWGAPGPAVRRTAIVIAHRLSTLERADDVLVIEGGRVVEHGERAALAADPSSRYARLRRAGGDVDGAAAPAAASAPASAIVGVVA